MGRDIPLGRIAGIKVGMNLAVPLLAAFYVWVLATGAFRNLEPDLADGWYWGAGVLGALLFFLSLLVHEIGHALVAQDEGIGVRSMALTPLGGVTRMESSPTTPGAEFRVSVVGPSASATCGVVRRVGAFLWPEAGRPGLAGHVFAWAGTVNLALAAFNLLPASPLDGGKVLSSIIWWRTGSQARAITWAAWAGLAIGGASIYLGLRGVELRGVDPAVARVTFLGIGAFVALSAWRELQSAPLIKALDGVTVAEAMVAGPPTAPSWLRLTEFLRTNAPSTEHQAYPVVDADGTVTGLLTAATIRSVPADRWPDLTVADLAFPLDRLVVVAWDEPLLPAIQKVDGGDLRDGLVAGPQGTIVGTLDDRALHRAVSQHRAGLAPAPT